MQASAEICTLKNSHARQNSPTSLMISKRLVMVCVRQETSNTMFTILSLCLVSVNVLTALLMCRTWLIRVYFSSHYHDLFQITIFTSRPFLKTAGGIVLGSVAVSAVSADVLPYISVVIKASFLKLGMCNICKNNIAKMLLDFLKILNCSFDRRF